MNGIYTDQKSDRYAPIRYSGFKRVYGISWKSLCYGTSDAMRRKTLPDRRAKLLPASDNA